MVPKIGKVWRRRASDGAVVQLGIVVDVTPAHVGVRVSWGVGFVPIAEFLRDWEPNDSNDDEITKVH